MREVRTSICDDSFLFLRRVTRQIKHLIIIQRMPTQVLPERFSCTPDRPAAHASKELLLPDRSRVAQMR